MTSEKQIAANRANAEHSTGPRTEEGKAASSQNAAKHSLTSKYLIILPGQQDAFAILESGLREKLVPMGPLEEVLFKRIVECAWNLERCRMAEFNLLGDSLIDPLASDINAGKYDRIHRYARESGNAMYKAMRELGKLQAEAQFRREISPFTQEQAVEFNCVSQTAYALSQVCLLSQVMRNVVAYRKYKSKAGLNPIDAPRPQKHERHPDRAAA